MGNKSSKKINLSFEDISNNKNETNASKKSK
jgi:hypothetical protein